MKCRQIWKGIICHNQIRSNPFGWAQTASALKQTSNCSSSNKRSKTWKGWSRCTSRTTATTSASRSPASLAWPAWPRRSRPSAPRTRKNASRSSRSRLWTLWCTSRATIAAHQAQADQTKVKTLTPSFTTTLWGRPSGRTSQRPRWLWHSWMTDRADSVGFVGPGQPQRIAATHWRSPST